MKLKKYIFWTFVAPHNAVFRNLQIRFVFNPFLFKESLKIKHSRMGTKMEGEFISLIEEREAAFFFLVA